MVLLSRVKFRPCIRRILSLVLELPFVNGGHRRLRSGQGGIQRNDSVPLFQKRLVQPGVQFSVPAGEGVPEQLHAAAVGGGEEEEGGIFIFQNHRVSVRKKPTPFFTRSRFQAKIQFSFMPPRKTPSAMELPSQL